MNSTTVLYKGKLCGYGVEMENLSGISFDLPFFRLVQVEFCFNREYFKKKL